MSMRDRINEAMKNALRAGDKRRLGTLRLMLSAIKDRDLTVKVDQSSHGEARDRIGDGEIVQVLQKMVKQRRDSIEAYRQGGRQDLVDQEAAEIAVIEEFLPKQMSEGDMRTACARVVSELGCSGLKDMGKAMTVLKERYAGQMDFGKASAVVKGLLLK